MDSLTLALQAIVTDMVRNEVDKVVPKEVEAQLSKRLTEPKEWLTKKEAARLLGCTTRTLERKLRAGEHLRYSKDEHGRVRVKAEDVKAYYRDHEQDKRFKR